MKHEGLSSAASPSIGKDLANARTVHWSPSPIRLSEMAVLRGEAKLASKGLLVCIAGTTPVWGLSFL
jgi:hypothetical protein